MKRKAGLGVFAGFFKKYGCMAMMNAVAIAMAIQTVNSTCGWFHHQPEVPAELKKFRKF